MTKFYILLASASLLILSPKLALAMLFTAFLLSVIYLFGLLVLNK